MSWITGCGNAALCGLGEAETRSAERAARVASRKVYIVVPLAGLGMESVPLRQGHHLSGSGMSPLLAEVRTLTS